MGQIGDGGMLVPSLQSSDINDGDIINGTQVEVENGSGRQRYHYTMPDGSPLSSDWVMPDHIRAARLQWVEAVKQQIVAQGARASEDAIRLARDAQLQSARLAIPEIQPDPAPGRDDPVGRTRHSEPSAQVHQVDDDARPADMAARWLLRASSDVLYWTGIEAEAAQKKTAAEAAVRRWEKVLQVLGED